MCLGGILRHASLRQTPAGVGLFLLLDSRSDHAPRICVSWAVVAPSRGCDARCWCRFHGVRESVTKCPPVRSFSLPQTFSCTAQVFSIADFSDGCKAERPPSEHKEPAHTEMQQSDMYSHSRNSDHVMQRSWSPTPSPTRGHGYHRRRGRRCWLSAFA